MKNTMTKIASVVIWCGVILVGLVGSSNAGLLGKEETPGERFDKAMKKLAARCVAEPPKAGDTACDPLKLKSADPLSTEEGRFAHSIKLPNGVPEDSGYKPGMTPQEYFDHLCRTESGEFIYQTVENVEGIMQLRPREPVTDYMLQHLYALEDPYGETYGEEFAMGSDALKDRTIQGGYVNPPYSQYLKDKSEKGYWLYKPDQNYKFLEKPVPTQLRKASFDNEPKYLRYTRPNTNKLILEDGQYFYRKHEQPQLREEKVNELKARYGFAWRGITRPRDRELGIAGGELIVLDLQTNGVLAVRRGFLRSGNVRDTVGGIWWLGARSCPSNRPGVNHTFMHKVLKPSKSIN